MTTIQAHIPDSLARQAQRLAEQEQVPFDMLVSLALASQISSGFNRNSIAERAKRGSWDKFDEVMEKVRAANRPPLPGDEPPQA